MPLSALLRVFPVLGLLLSTPLASSTGAETAAPPASGSVQALAARRSLPLGPGASQSPRNASYRLQVTLDEKNHRLLGKGLLTWRNLERKPCDKLVFHLYQNAFKNLASTFVFEAGAALRGAEMPERGYGAIDVSTLRINGRDSLAAAAIDDTLLTVPLPTPLGPSATAEIEFSWSLQLPKIFARAGWAETFHAVGQWFPKIGVWDCSDGDSCRWRAHQYHGVTEFFADFGVYDVEIDVPRATQVGATGVLTAERFTDDRRIVSYHAEDVHDFAFFADPAFIEVRDTVDDGHGPIAIRLLTRAGQEGHTARTLAGVRAAIWEATERLGAYPYSNLTVVVPPLPGNGAGGMEYPTLITVFSLPLPAGLHDIEETAAHEYGHQYFYQLFASDEVEEAWLDEGLNETFSGWVMQRMFGRCSAVNLPYLCLSAWDRSWLAYRESLRHAALATPSYRLPPSHYGSIVYTHTAVLLHMLEGLLGPDALREGLRRYGERSRFRHPGRRDFVAALSEGARQDLSWYFSQALDQARVVDYAVSEVSSERFELAAGYYDCPPRLPESAGSELSSAGQRAAYRELLSQSQEAACRGKPAGRHELLTTATEVKPAQYSSRVVVSRLGDFLLPVKIRAVFADGQSEEREWSLAEQQALPEQRVRELYFARRPQRLLYAEVDPEGRLVADLNPSNNSRFVERRPRPVARLWLSFVGAVSSLIDLLGS